MPLLRSGSRRVTGRLRAASMERTAAEQRKSHSEHGVWHSVLFLAVHRNRCRCSGPYRVVGDQEKRRPPCGTRNGDRRPDLGYVGVAFVPFILIIAAIAIPNLLRSKMAANEASAVGSLRTLNTAMVTYATECPKIGYPKDLRRLGPGLSETDKCAHADLVDAQLGTALPMKYGYHFFYTPQVDADGLVTRYVLAADPVTPGTSGARHFFTDESGVIRYSMRGGADVNSQPLM
jgi:type IV pilus assembly protein PilA